MNLAMTFRNIKEFYLPLSFGEGKGVRWIIIPVLLIATFSCNLKREEIPENILIPSKMTDVLVDVNILEASIGLNLIKENDTISKDTNLFYNVFENNRITKKQYDESMNYYMHHPELLNEIYDSVLVRLDAEKAQLQKK